MALILNFTRDTKSLNFVEKNCDMKCFRQICEAGHYARASVYRTGAVLVETDSCLPLCNPNCLLEYRLFLSKYAVIWPHSYSIVFKEFINQRKKGIRLEIIHIFMVSFFNGLTFEVLKRSENKLLTGLEKLIRYVTGKVRSSAQCFMTFIDIQLRKNF